MWGKILLLDIRILVLFQINLKQLWEQALNDNMEQMMIEVLLRENTIPVNNDKKRKTSIKKSVNSINLAFANKIIDGEPSSKDKPTKVLKSLSTPQAPKTLTSN